MKSTNHNGTPCAIFGHNYVKTKTNPDDSSQFTCSQCATVINTDPKGNFESHSISNKEIRSTLRQLYHLRRHLAKSS